MAEADAELLARLLAGEQRAFRELVSTYQGAMRAVAYAIVGSRNADEVVQDAWLAVVRNLDGFQQRASLKTWLLTITANTAKSRLKQQRREPLLDDLPAPHGSRPMPRMQSTALSGSSRAAAVPWKTLTRSASPAGWAASTASRRCCEGPAARITRLSCSASSGQQRPASGDRSRSRFGSPASFSARRSSCASRQSSSRRRRAPPCPAAQE